MTACFCSGPTNSDKDFLSLRFKYFFAFLALIALLAKLAPLVNAKPPGTPMFTKASVIFPEALSCAVSSKIFMPSKNFSTFAAVLVSAPKSINCAPKDITPSGIFIAPEAIPAKADSINPTSFSSGSSSSDPTSREGNED